MQAQTTNITSNMQELSTPNTPRSVIDSTYGGSTPFILLARCHVKEDRLDEYLEAARVADAGVKESEPGMLHHTFDVDPSDPLMYV